MNKTLITAVVVLIVAGGAGFYGGMKYQQSKTSANRLTGSARQFGNFAGRTGGGTGTGSNSFRPVNGQILSAGNNTLTVKLSDGSSKVVILTSTTQINKAAQGTVADLQVGTTIAVMGQANSDGSVTAQSIQLNPMARGNTSPSPVSQ
jgi:hypothetical protein